MKEIGGYFELELRKGMEYHPNAIALNTGRNALELILITKKFKKVYIPYFTCDAILEPFDKHHISYEFYHINIDFEPEFDFSNIRENEVFLYTNYFGLKDRFINKIATLCTNLIIDSTQSFFSKPIIGVPTFYSCRKFFGVPDGAYLYLDGINETDFLNDYSETRFSHLLRRIEYGAEVGYIDFKKNEEALVAQPILRMSKLTKSLLTNIDYEFVKEKRIENFNFFHDKLSTQNELEIDIAETSTPFIYPFLLKQDNIKQYLIDKKVFVPTYWVNVLKWVNNDDLEYKITTKLNCLPIDQRYSSNELTEIVKLIQFII